MDTRDLIIGAIVGGFLVWLWTRQQQNILMQELRLQGLNKSNKSYENDEICYVMRNKEGFISQLRVKRDAHVNS